LWGKVIVVVLRRVALTHARLATQPNAVIALKSGVAARVSLEFVYFFYNLESIQNAFSVYLINKFALPHVSEVEKS
jgi:hypothetical protein